jgi:hypothetical protein
MKPQNLSILYSNFLKTLDFDWSKMKEFWAWPELVQIYCPAVGADMSNYWAL